RFTLLIVDFLKERFVWAKRKPDTTDADHDKRIAENYVYDEVLGVNVPRSEFERRAKFNNDQTSPEAGVYGNESDQDKTVRFPSRQRVVEKHVNALDYIPKPSAGKMLSTSELTLSRSSIKNKNQH
ncbi:conjugal transfer protein, partial [Escherichia coli]|nr:conjugal transfer protein [Escherichia coli]